MMEPQIWNMDHTNIAAVKQMEINYVYIGLKAKPHAKKITRGAVQQKWLLLLRINTNAPTDVNVRNNIPIN